MLVKRVFWKEKAMKKKFLRMTEEEEEEDLPGIWFCSRIKRRRGVGAFNPWVLVYVVCLPSPLALGLSLPVYKGIMKKGYRVPTPIQRKV